MPRSPSHRSSAPPRRARGTGRLRALFGLGVVGVLGATGTTFAAWTDSVPVTGTSFSTGTLDLRVQGQDHVVGYTDLTLATMVPGSTVAGVLTVRNAGTAPLLYAATTSATDPDGKGLRSTLVVEVTGAATVTGTAPAATCGGPALPGTGTALGGSLVGTGRLLGAGASETLCVEVTLPAAAPSSLQGATTQVGLTFTATSDLA